MSFIEDIFLFPVKLLMKLLWLMLPLIVLVVVFIVLARYPYMALGFSIGFLVAPCMLRKLGVYHIDVSNSLGVFELKNQELGQLKTIYHSELDQSTEKYYKKEQRFQRKIQKLQQETKQLDKTYNELLDGKPDRIVYTQPRSFFQLMKNRLFCLGRG
jgi:hypothetical protein